MKLIHWDRSPTSPSGSMDTYGPISSAECRRTSSTLQPSSGRATLPTSRSSPLTRTPLLVVVVGYLFKVAGDDFPSAAVALAVASSGMARMATQPTAATAM